MKNNKITSSTVSAESFAAKPRSVLLSHSSPSYQVTARLVGSFHFVSVFPCVREGM